MEFCMSQKHFSGRTMSSDGPALGLAAVTPDDAADLPRGVCRSLYVAGAGVVVLDDMGGETVELISGATQYHPIHVRRVRATGTTATGIVALY
jgi:hypothetical protein